MVPRVLLLLLAVQTLASCDGRDGSESSPDLRAFATLTDDAGRALVLKERPTRILALVPSATEMLRALGLENALVGRTDYDVDPALSHLPSVGGGLQASVERIVSLRPDLVVRFEAETDRATAEQLDRAGVPHLAVRPDGVEDIRRIIRMLGVATGRVGEAEALLDELDADLLAVAQMAEGRAKPRVAFLLGGDPPWVVGPGTFLHDLLQIAGGENVFEDEGGLYTQVNVEEVLRRRPDLIVAMEGARLPASLSRIPVRRVPGEVQAPGHLVGASARLVLDALHPESTP